jgi:putative membrane protein
MTGMNIPLLVAGSVFAGLAALIHVYFFVLESLRWMRPSTMRIFQVPSEAAAGATKLLAYNQGFYNLFLAIGIGVGVVLLAAIPAAGVALILAGCASMVLAAVVLLSANRKMARAAGIQGVLPLVAIVLVAAAIV